MGRSAAYWAANPYRMPQVEPPPTAPYRDLPGTAGERFRRARSGVLAIRGVAEQVRFMGLPWAWTWEYAIGPRKLCWLHPVTSGVSATFTLSDDEEARVLALPRLAEALRQAVRDGQRTGPVKWCWVGFADRRQVDAFLGLLRRKAEWLLADPAIKRRAKVY
ncbi:MAG TPA: hypothetical protein VFK09_00710 [Gemmatimonadales bacterium]|jgi:hypothetical protein|nr:hypothetical protein [Gemmatimonadales bacterium]